MTDDGWDQPTQFDDPSARGRRDDDDVASNDDESRDADADDDVASNDDESRDADADDDDGLDTDDFADEDPASIRGTAEQRSRARQAAIANRLAGTTEPVRRITAQGAAVELRVPADADPDDISGRRITGRIAAVAPDASSYTDRAARITAQGAAVEPREPASADPDDASGSRITGRESIPVAGTSKPRQSKAGAASDIATSPFRRRSPGDEPEGAPRIAAPGSGPDADPNGRRRSPSSEPTSTEGDDALELRDVDASSRRRSPSSEPTGGAASPPDLGDARASSRRRPPSSEPTSANPIVIGAVRAKRPSDESTAAAAPLALHTQRANAIAPRTRADSESDRPSDPTIVADELVPLAIPARSMNAGSRPSLSDRRSDPTIVADVEADAFVTIDAPSARSSRASTAPPLHRAKTAPPAPGTQAPVRGHTSGESDASSRLPLPAPLTPDPDDTSSTRLPLRPPASRDHDDVSSSRLPLRAPASRDRDDVSSTRLPLRAPASRDHDDVSSTRLPLRAPATPDPDAEPVATATLRGTGAAGVAPMRSTTGSARLATESGRARSTTESARLPSESGRARSTAESARLPAADIRSLAPASMRPKTPTSGMRTLGTPSSGSRLSGDRSVVPLVTVVANLAEHPRVQQLAGLAGVAVSVVDDLQHAPADATLVLLGQSWQPDRDPRIAYVARASITDEDVTTLLVALAGGATADPAADLAAPQTAAEAKRSQVAATGARAFATADDHVIAEAGAIATIRELVESDRAYVLWYDAATANLRSMIRDRDRGDDRRAIAGIAGWCARTGRAVVVAAASVDARWLGPIDDPDGDSNSRLAIQPVVDSAGRVRAVLIAARRANRTAFTVHDTALLARFAALVAPLVDPLALHVETKALLGTSSPPLGTSPTTARPMRQRVMRELAALPPWALVVAVFVVVAIVVALAL